MQNNQINSNQSKHEEQNTKVFNTNVQLNNENQVQNQDLGSQQKILLNETQQFRLNDHSSDESMKLDDHLFKSAEEVQAEEIQKMLKKQQKLEEIVLQQSNQMKMQWEMIKGLRFHNDTQFETIKKLLLPINKIQQELENKDQKQEEINKVLQDLIQVSNQVKKVVESGQEENGFSFVLVQQRQEDFLQIMQENLYWNIDEKVFQQQDKFLQEIEGLKSLIENQDDQKVCQKNQENLQKENQLLKKRLNSQKSIVNQLVSYYDNWMLTLNSDMGSINNNIAKLIQKSIKNYSRQVWLFQHIKDQYNYQCQNYSYNYQQSWEIKEEEFQYENIYDSLIALNRQVDNILRNFEITGSSMKSSLDSLQEKFDEDSENYQEKEHYQEHECYQENEPYYEDDYGEEECY